MLAFSTLLWLTREKNVVGSGGRGHARNPQARMCEGFVAEHRMLSSLLGGKSTRLFDMGRSFPEQQSLALFRLRRPRCPARKSDGPPSVRHARRTTRAAGARGGRGSSR